jgi:hypothetical protein
VRLHPRSRRGKVCAPGCRGRPARSPLLLLGHATQSSEPRGQGYGPSHGRLSSYPRPASSSSPHCPSPARPGLTLRPGPWRRAVGEGASSFSCRLLSPAGRRGRPVRRHRPMLPARTSPLLPGGRRGPDAPRSRRRRPAAPLRAAPRPRPRAARLQSPLRPRRTRALPLTSPERHMSSLGLRIVPLQRRSGRGRQTLTEGTQDQAQPRGRALGPSLGLLGERPYFC